MPVLASNPLPLSEYPRAKRIISAFKIYLQTARPGLLSGTTADNVIALYFDARRFRVDMAAVALVPGVVQFAKDQENDQAYEVATEFATMTAAVDALTTEIASLYPVDGSGYLLDRQLSGDVLVFRDFTTPQLAALVPLVDAVIAAIT